MKTINKYTFQIIAAVFISIAMYNALHESAFSFIKSITEKNILFLGLVTDIKLILYGVKDVHIPFFSGTSEGLSDSLNKVELSLMFVNVISLVQLMLLAISKSIAIKILLLILLLLSFFKQSKVLASKILILALALNPGLTLFAIGMNYMSQEAHFDFGASYSQELQSQVHSMKKEQSQLMQEHTKRLTQIENGQNKTLFFQKLKEDMSYDLKDLKLHMKGEYVHLRTLFQGTGNTMVHKLINFCTMILFCLLLMPLLYSLLIGILYKHLFPTSQLTLSNIRDIGKEINKNIPNVSNQPTISRSDIRASDTQSQVKEEPKKTVHDNAKVELTGDSKLKDELPQTSMELKNELTQSERFGEEKSGSIMKI